MADEMCIIVAARVPLADVIESLINQSPRSIFTLETALHGVQLVLLKQTPEEKCYFGRRDQKAVEVNIAEIEAALQSLILQQRIIGDRDGHYHANRDGQDGLTRFIAH